MTTLRIDGIPDEVVDTLTERAAAAGMSLSAYVVAYLEQSVRTPAPSELRQLRPATRRSFSEVSRVTTEESTAAMIEDLRGDR